MVTSLFHFEWADFEEARTRLKKVAVVTPLLASKSLAGAYLKAENLQTTGSFKIRAAFNQLSQLSREELDRGIVTSSSGNFAQSVAFGAKLLGASAKIVMMTSASPIKVEGVRRWGGEVVFCEDRFEARAEMVSRIEADESRTVVHPFDRPEVVAGNATAFLEILEQHPGVRNIVVPISGGGLICGIAVAAKMHSSAVQVLGVQPSGSNATFLSFRAGHPIRIERAQTVADGLTVTAPGSYTFPLIQEFVDDIVTVEEATIGAAVRQLLLEEKLLVEPSGAVPVAAVLEGKVPLQDTVFLLSGGNVRPDYIAALL